MYCKNCGKEIREGAVFCAECGTKVDSDTLNVKEEKAHKKNIKTICGNIIGAVIIAFGLIGCTAQVVYGIGMILFGLLFISPVRNKITSSLKLKNKWIYVIWVIVSLLIMSVGIGLTPDSEPNEASSEPEIIDIESVDVLFEGDDYINKTVRVKGSVNYEDVSTGDMKMYGEYSDAEVYLQGSEKYEMPESECAIVTGVVELDEYDIPTIVVKKFKPCTDENCSHNDAYVEEPTSEAVEEKIYPVSDVHALLTTDKLVNQKVSISGQINGAGAEIWLETPEGDVGVYLYDTEENGMLLVSEYLMEYCYGYYNITGTFYYEYDEPVIFVDSIS